METIYWYIHIRGILNQSLLVTPSFFFLIFYMNIQGNNILFWKESEQIEEETRVSHEEPKTVYDLLTWRHKGCPKSSHDTLRFFVQKPIFVQNVPDKNYKCLLQIYFVLLKVRTS